MEADNQRNLILWFFLICFLISFLLLGKLIAPFFSIIVLAGVLTGIFYPLFRLLQFSHRVRPPLASFVTCLILFFILFVPIALFVGVLTQEAFGLYELARNAVRNDQIKNLLQNSKVLERANDFLVPLNFQVTGDQLQAIISEVGAVMLVGGNIEGRSRVLTTAIVLETRKGNFDLAVALGLVLLGLAFITNAAMLRLQGRAFDE